MFPTRTEYLDLLIANDRAHESTLDQLDGSSELLGSTLSILYRIATCHVQCRGGDHRFEHLAGRAYNHACGAVLLIRHGYYDEARNLSRSIGEISNLLRLFFHEPQKYEEWVSCSRAARLQNFSPRAVREMIENNSSLPAPMDRVEYRELCETATHPTPATIPNPHSDTDTALIGGIPQLTAADSCLADLSSVLCKLTMCCAKLVDQDTLFSELTSDLASYVSENAV